MSSVTSPKYQYAAEPAGRRRITRRRFLLAAGGLGVLGTGAHRGLCGCHRADGPHRDALRDDAAGLAEGPQAQHHGDCRPSCRRARHGPRAHRARRRCGQRFAVRPRRAARRLFRDLPLRHRAGSASGLGRRTGAAQGAARRVGDPRQSRLVARHRRRAPRACRCAHSGDGERRRAARPGRQPLLAGRHRRPARLSSGTWPLSRRGRSAGDARSHHDRRSRCPAGARAGYFRARCRRASR